MWPLYLLPDMMALSRPTTAPTLDIWCAASRDTWRVQLPHMQPLYQVSKVVATPPPNDGAASTCLVHMHAACDIGMRLARIKRSDVANIGTRCIAQLHKRESAQRRKRPDQTPGGTKSPHRLMTDKPGETERALAWMAAWL